MKASGALPEGLEVWLDDATFGPLTHLGRLHRSGADAVRFEYSPLWLKNDAAFALDPELSLASGNFHPRESNFGIFMDSCPDRWGQTLMKRRELVEARQQQRARRELRAWDFFLGVQDITRMGALRFSALQSDKRLRHGARPKANLQDGQGQLWMAKFPGADDQHDWALREMLVHQLAAAFGLRVAPARLERMGQGHHTFVTRRFDREGGRRRFFTSAMAVLGRSDSEDASYLDLAEFIASRQGVPGKLDEDLRELFRRVLFNVAVANRDDHLRNHGFIRDTRGWRLAPAYDLNPSTTKDHHVLALDESSTEPDLGTVLATAAYYKVTVQQAERGCGAPAPGAQHVEEQGQAAGAVGRGSRRVGSLLHGVTATSRGLWQ